MAVLRKVSKARQLALTPRRNGGDIQRWLRPDGPAAPSDLRPPRPEAAAQRLRTATAERGTGLRVLHAVEVIRGGTATYLHTVAPSQLATLGRDNVHFLVPDQQQQELARIGTENVRAFHYPGRTLRGFVAYLLALRKAVREVKPDLVHAHGTFSGLYVRLCSPIWGARRPRIVYCAHGWSFLRRERPYKLWLYIAIERLLARFCDAIINISRSEIEAALAAKLPSRRLTLIFQGLPELPASALPRAADLRRQGKITLLFVGRLDVQKGFDILMRCFRHLDEDKYQLYVAGESVLANEGITARLGPIPPNVVFLGWQTSEQLAALYAGVDAVVMPSRWEGFGFVAVEAMRAGCAVIASKVGGLREIVLDGRTGLLFDVDRPEQLTDILRRLTPEDLRQLGQEGRRRFVEEFVADRMCRELLALYRAVCRPVRAL